MENPDTKCRPLSFTWAFVNVTCWHAWHKVCEQACKGKWKLAMNANTIRGTVTDMAKGQNLTHIGFHWRTGSFMKKHTYWEIIVTIWNTTHWTYDTVALNCRHFSPLTHIPTAFSSFFISQSVLPASHLKLSKSPLLLLVYPPYTPFEGVTAVRGKTDPAVDFQLNCQKLAVLINPAQ